MLMLATASPPIFASFSSATSFAKACIASGSSPALASATFSSRTSASPFDFGFASRSATAFDLGALMTPFAADHGFQAVVGVLHRRLHEIGCHRRQRGDDRGRDRIHAVLPYKPALTATWAAP